MVGLAARAVGQTTLRSHPVARLAVSGLALAIGLGLAVGLLRPWIGRMLEERLGREAARHGATLRLGSVDLGLWPPLRLNALRVEKARQWTLTIDSVAVTPRASLRGIRVSLGFARLVHRSGLEVEARPTRWDVESSGRGHRAELRAPAVGLVATWGPDATGSHVALHAENLAAGRIFGIRRGERPLLDPGFVEGALEATIAPEEAAVDIDLRSRDVRMAALSEPPPGGVQEAGFGEPTDVALHFQGSWRPMEGRLEVPDLRVMAGGADASGRLEVSDLPRDPQIDLTVAVERVDFARLLGASGLEPPPALAEGVAGAEDLGSASLSARVRGRLRDARSFTVAQRIDFRPPPRPIAALERLRGDFDHEVAGAGGGRRVISVSPASPDFVALGDVPPLFVRTLLLGEDTGFFGHQGIDLSEVPSALLTNWERGGVARGASTITQQLAKNLFLSRDKRVGRKLQELCLALLLEATLSKDRLLEIYLNVIEWGPDLYGLRPAARRYFDKEPKALTPREMAFLVALIPGPVKYQRSFADGTLSPGFRPLTDDLLAKLHSVGALTPEEHEAALHEVLVVRTGEALR